MNFTKNMTTVLSFALLFSSVSMMGWGMPAFVSKDNAKAAGSKLFSWMPTIALGGYCVHLALRLKALEAKKAAAEKVDADAVVAELIKDNDFVGRVGNVAATSLSVNDAFKTHIVAQVKDGLFTQEQPKFVVKSLLRADIFTQNGTLLPAMQMRAWTINPRGAAHSQEKEQE